MEFKISRTSMWNDKKPCDNAYRKKIIRVDERGFKSFEDHDEIWVIEINTLEDLLDLKEKYGEIIVCTAYENPNINELEIYDDWRE